MIININENIKHYLELEKHSEIFLKETKTLNLKVFLL